jgi:hypothetical protein
MWQDPLIRYVARMVAFVSSESKSEKETAATLVPAQRLSLFGPPPLIAGEDGAAYDQLPGPLLRGGKAGRYHRRNAHNRRRVLGMGDLAVAPLEMEFGPSART